MIMMKKLFFLNHFQITGNVTISRVHGSTQMMIAQELLHIWSTLKHLQMRNMLRQKNAAMITIIIIMIIKNVSKMVVADLDVAAMATIAATVRTTNLVQYLAIVAIIGLIVSIIHMVKTFDLVIQLQVVVFQTRADVVVVIILIIIITIAEDAVVIIATPAVVTLVVVVAT